jgi:alpha-tubulin suppressor-like RCC1 family protein
MEYFELLHCKNKTLPPFRSVHSCGSTTFAITQDNWLFSWGYNNHGQLGQGDADDVCLPARVHLMYSDMSRDLCVLPKIWQVTCGHNHALVLTATKRIMSCGNNSFGQLGRADLDFSASCSRFVEVYPLAGQPTTANTGVRSVASGAYVCAMILEDDSLWLWGNHTFGQVPGARRPGGGFLPQKSPLKIDDVVSDNGDQEYTHDTRPPFRVESISISADHCACISTDKRVWTWGMNLHGKLGNGTKNGSSCRPTRVMSASQLQIMSSPVQICCGGHHTLIRSTLGTLWAAGAHRFGTGIQGGHESSLCRFQRVVLPMCAHVDGGGDMRVFGMAAGTSHSAIITSCGHVMTCGKMKASVHVTPMFALRGGHITAYSGFGGLGYFQGLAQQGHVVTFQKVHQLHGKVAFSTAFSASTRAKVTAFLLGVHFDSVARAGTTRDRVFMNALPEEVADMVIRKILLA